MENGWTSWRRMMRAGTMVAETLDASGRVIGSRGDSIAAAMADPLNADHAELALMVQEKVAAFSLAGAALAGSWMKLQQDLATQTMAMIGGASSSPRQWRAMAARQQRIGTAALAGTINALAPIHAAATANDRRLRKR